jgi:hypothetical protein
MMGSIVEKVGSPCVYVVVLAYLLKAELFDIFGCREKTTVV